MSKIITSTILLCLFFLIFTFTSATAFEPMLPQTYTTQSTVAGWWMSEKLDGIRAYWDGSELYSKNGVRFAPPPEFTAGLPPFPLEGELWSGRGTFELTASIVMRQQAHAGWLTLRLAVFDVPAASGPFHQRIKQAGSWFDQHPSPYAFVIDQLVVENYAHLQQELKRIEGLGGEGLIVRDPNATYQIGRRPHILKVKRVYDAEATVMAHLPGQGRNSGRLGALLVKSEDGVEFRIGSGLSDAVRDHPPAIGTIITYQFFGQYPSGIPKFPSYVRVRSDQDLR
ncbi:MAG: DNA ligase [Pelovirga sp.]